MVTVDHLTKRYGSRLAIDDVSFQVALGEVVGFLGPNGAGKSSTLRILAGFLGPTSGHVTVAGHDVVAEPIEARRCIGYMPESVPLYTEMRVVEYLRYRAELKRVGSSQRASYVDDAMNEAGVVDVANRRIAHLSKGYRQRVGLADAIVAKPPVVILDEPTNGLDPNQVRDARAVVRELGRDRAVVISTHVLSEVEACATRVILLHKGKLVAQGTTAAVRALCTQRTVELTVRGSPALAAVAVGSVPGVTSCEADSRAAPGAHTLRATFDPAFSAEDRGCAIESLIAKLVAAGLGVRRVHETGGSLEDAFAELTREVEPAIFGPGAKTRPRE
ncbi:MAG: ABC transporter ATP-binding protein [Polyangiaceae bacterium]